MARAASHRIGIGRGTGDGDRHHLRGAFAAAHDAQRELVRDDPEPLEQRRVEPFVNHHAAGAIGKGERRSRWSRARRPR